MKSQNLVMVHVRHYSESVGIEPGKIVLTCRPGIMEA
jgi:hypothetical protein